MLQSAEQRDSTVTIRRRELPSQADLVVPRRIRTQLPLVLRVLGRLPLMNDAACSVGRRPRSLKEGNRGPG